ncbi:MAG: molybdenum cofactor biosynthesis protein MoaE, partial [Pseudomonadota bacterium]
MPVKPRIAVQADDFSAQDEAARLTEGRKDVGALVTFTGLCRDEAGTLTALELEHYPGMAEAELTRIAEEAIDRWPLTGLTVI